MMFDAFFGAVKSTRSSPQGLSANKTGSRLTIRLFTSVMPHRYAVTTSIELVDADLDIFMSQGGVLDEVGLLNARHRIRVLSMGLRD